MGGCPQNLHPVGHFPAHVTRAAGQEGPQVFELPEQVQLLILVAHEGDALAVEATQHSDSCWTLYVFTRDEGLRVWIAHLSLDERWTLSPAY